MFNFKRSLLLVMGLLCAICFAACGNAAQPGNGVAAQGDANNNAATVTVVPTAAPQKTAEPVKVQSQGQQGAQKQNQDQQGGQQGAQNQGQQAPAPAANNGNQQPAQAGNQGAQNQAPQNNNNNGGNGGGSGTVVASAQLNVNGQMQVVLTTGTGMVLYYRTTDPAPGSTCTGECAKAWPPFIAQGNIIPADNFQGQLTTHMTANGNQVEYNGHPLYTYANDNAHQATGQGVQGVWNAVTVLPQKQHW